VPWNNDQWWRFRIPGSGSVDWKAFFTVLSETGYDGAMNIENEDEFCGEPYENGIFTAGFKRGFIVSKITFDSSLPGDHNDRTPSRGPELMLSPPIRKAGQLSSERGVLP
jgi:hypothetical protein